MWVWSLAGFFTTNYTNYTNFLLVVFMEVGLVLRGMLCFILVDMGVDFDWVFYHKLHKLHEFLVCCIYGGGFGIVGSGSILISDFWGEPRYLGRSGDRLSLPQSRRLCGAFFFNQIA